MQTFSHRRQQTHNIGYMGVIAEQLMNLERRLRFVQFLKVHPEIRNIPVREPLFVMGLPRTGTTFLHHLLSLDPASRSPLMWELMNPIPNEEIGTYSEATAHEHVKDREFRAEHIRSLIRLRSSLGDFALKHIHEIVPDEPEECVMTLNNDMPLSPMLLHDTFTNWEHVLRWDAVRAYSNHKAFLQILNYQCGQSVDPPRWVLKCPLHLYYIKDILQVFPDAKFVWTHRHPTSAVPSLCSLMSALHTVYYEPDYRDDVALGRSIVNCTEWLLTNTPKVLQETGAPHVDVVYNKLVKDPVGTVRSIYAACKWEFTAEYEKILNDYLEKNIAHRESVAKAKGTKDIHEYTFEKFGLTEKELCEGVFAEYVDKFNLPKVRHTA